MHLKKTEKTLEAVEAAANLAARHDYLFTHFNKELKAEYFELALKFRTFAVSI